MHCCLAVRIEVTCVVPTFPFVHPAEDVVTVHGTGMYVLC
jgi:hypothetical protein